jgi:hypothetical protein
MQMRGSWAFGQLNSSVVQLEKGTLRWQHSLVRIVYGIIIALIVLTWFINRKLNQGRAAKEAPARRFLPF